MLKRVQEPLVRSRLTRRSEEMGLGVVPLGRGGPGLRGVVESVGAGAATGALASTELERRLLEIGFVEGARIEILHQGVIGGDPIAVKLDDMRVALRRREADAVLVRVEGGRMRPMRGARPA